MTKTKTFDLRRVKDYDQAERFKAKLENDGYSVTLQSIGFNRLRIIGRKPN